MQLLLKILTALHGPANHGAGAFWIMFTPVWLFPHANPAGWRIKKNRRVWVAR
jgi:hypothetical protein